MADARASNRWSTFFRNRAQKEGEESSGEGDPLGTPSTAAMLEAVPPPAPLRTEFDDVVGGDEHVVALEVAVQVPEAVHVVQRLRAEGGKGGEAGVSNRRWKERSSSPRAFIVP